MTVMAVDTPIERRDNIMYADFPVNATSQIYKGSLVSLDATGNAIASADTAGTKFVGIATANVLGGSSDGDTWIRVESGRTYLMIATSITQAMVGDAMVVVDSATIDDTAGASNDIVVGYLVEYVSATSGWVFIAPTMTAIPVAGVTSSAAELNMLDGSIAGTVVASRAVVVDASKDIATFGTVGAAATTITSAAAGSLSVGRQGATNPAFQVDSSTGTQIGGIKVTGSAAGGTTAVVCTDSGANNSLTIDAKGNGTVAIAATSTGAVTITPATTVAGILTPAGGVGAVVATTKVLEPAGNVHTQGVPAVVSTDGTDQNNTNTEAYCGALVVAANCTSTGAKIFNGSAVSGNVYIILFNSDGTAAIATTGAVARAGTDVYQVIPWTAPVSLLGPTTYYVAVVAADSGAGSKINMHVFGAGAGWKETGLTYPTVASITPVTTFTTNVCPYVSLY